MFLNKDAHLKDSTNLKDVSFNTGTFTPAQKPKFGEGTEGEINRSLFQDNTKIFVS